MGTLTMRSNFRSFEGLCDDLEIGDRVLDFLALVEARAADHAIGQARRDEAIFDGAHLERRAHEDCASRSASGPACALQLLDVGRRSSGLLLRRPRRSPVTVTRSPASPSVNSVLPKSALVAGDQTGGGCKDMAGRAIVAFEADDLRAREILVEAQDVVDLGAAPAIDRLVVIAHAADVGRTLRQQSQPQVLDDVGVLVLVDQNVAEAAVVFLARTSGFSREQAEAFEQQIAEVGQAFSSFRRLLIGRIEGRTLAAAEGIALAGWNLARASGRGSSSCRSGRRVGGRASAPCPGRRLRSPASAAAADRHSSRMVKPAFQADEFGVAAQDLDADRMEGAEPRHGLDRAADEALPMRSFISRAALFVKVTARIWWPMARFVAMMWAMRVVSTRVLPVPAPARTRTGPSRASTGFALLGIEAFEIGWHSCAAERALGNRAAGLCRSAGAVWQVERGKIIVGHTGAR